MELNAFGGNWSSVRIESVDGIICSYIVNNQIIRLMYIKDKVKWCPAVRIPESERHTSVRFLFLGIVDCVDTDQVWWYIRDVKRCLLVSHYHMNSYEQRTMLQIRFILNYRKQESVWIRNQHLIISILRKRLEAVIPSLERGKCDWGVKRKLSGMTSSCTIACRSRCRPW